MTTGHQAAQRSTKLQRKIETRFQQVCYPSPSFLCTGRLPPQRRFGAQPPEGRLLAHRCAFLFLLQGEKEMGGRISFPEKERNHPRPFWAPRKEHSLMYVAIGPTAAVRRRDIVGIFDLDNVTWSHRTRKSLAVCEKQGCVVSVGGRSAPRPGGVQRARQHLQKMRRQKSARRACLCGLHDPAFRGHAGKARGARANLSKIRPAGR